MESCRVSVNLNNVEKLQNLMRYTQGDDIYLMIYQNKLFVVINYGEVYSHMCFNLLQKCDSELITVLMSRSKFGGLLTNGIVEIIIVGGKVTFDFKGEGNKTKMMFSFPHVEGDVGKIYSKLLLTTKLNDYPTLNLTGLGTFTRIARAGLEPVNFNDGMCFIKNNNMAVFHKSCLGRFAINSKLMYLLISMKDSITYDVQNYICSVDGDIVIMLQKLKNVEESDYDFIKKRKDEYAIRFDMDAMLTLSKKLKLGDGEFYIDLDKEECEFVDGHYRYKAPLQVKAKNKVEEPKEEKRELTLAEKLEMARGISQVEIKRNDKREYPKLQLSSAILNRVLNKFTSATSMVMRIKKKFILISIDGTEIVTSRVEVE